MSRSCPALPSRAVVLWELFKTMHGQDKSGPWSTMRAPHCSCNALWQHFWWDDDSVIEWHFQATIPVPTCLFSLLLAEIMFGRAHPFCSLRSNGPIKIHDFCICLQFQFICVFPWKRSPAKRWAEFAEMHWNEASLALAKCKPKESLYYKCCLRSNLWPMLSFVHWYSSSLPELDSDASVCLFFWRSVPLSRLSFPSKWWTYMDIDVSIVDVEICRAWVQVSTKQNEKSLRSGWHESLRKQSALLFFQPLTVSLLSMQAFRSRTLLLADHVLRCKIRSLARWISQLPIGIGHDVSMCVAVLL